LLCTGQSQDHSDSFTELSEGIDLGWSDVENNNTTDDDLWGSSDEDDGMLVWDQDSSIHTSPPAHHTTTNPTMSAMGDTIMTCPSEMLTEQPINLTIPTNEIPAVDELISEMLADKIVTLNTSSETDVGSCEDDKMDSLVTVASVPPTLPFSAILSDSSPQYMVNYKALDNCLHDITLLSRDAEQDNNTCFDALGDLPSSPSLTNTDETISFEGTIPLGHTHNILTGIDQHNVDEVSDEFEDFVEEDFDWD